MSFIFGNGDKKNKKQKEKFIIDALTDKLKKVQEEIENLKKKLEKKVKIAAKRIVQLRKALREEKNFSQKLEDSLNKATSHIKSLNKLLNSFPLRYATFLEFVNFGEGQMANVLHKGERLMVNIAPNVDLKKLKKGIGVIINESSVIIGIEKFEKFGTEAKVTSLLSENRVKVSINEQEVLIDAVDFLSGKLKVGDKVLVDPKSNLIYEILPKSEIDEVILEEVTNVKYEDIGGLDKELEEIRNKIEEPFLKPEIYQKYKREVTKGLVLYGAPGCGKTMMAKAIANSIISKAKEKYGQEKNAYFFNIKGPELSSKWVGETERQIREVFNKAKELAKKDLPVVIFFDEADSFLARRGSRISSDANKNYVAQFCAEIDGVESLSNVIIILATNRIDLLDPAVLRPGRLDFKIRIKQPDEKSAKDIFLKYFTTDLPYDGKYFNQEIYPLLKGDINLIRNYLAEKIVERIYREDEKNKFIAVKFKSEKEEIFRYKDFISGAMIKNIVDRAKDKAIRSEIERGVSGMRLKYLYEAAEDEFKENEDLPSTIDAINEWAQIKGIKEEIVDYKFLIDDKKEKDWDNDYPKKRMI